MGRGTGIVKGKVPSLYMQRLAPLLESLPRGATLTDEQILQVVPELLRPRESDPTGPPAGARFLDGLLRKWFARERGIAIKRQGNAGYYLLTDIEQARCPSKRARTARRAYARGLSEGHGVNPAELPDDVRGRLENHMRVVATQLALATDAVRQVRWELSGSTARKALAAGK